jgi:antitoxin component YwqK of YwqJK toxin-antitoxin module
MKKISTITLLILSHWAGAQSIWFQLHRTDGCTNETKIDSTDYYLIDKNGTGYRNTEGTVWLPATGEYEIFYVNRQDNHAYPMIQITGNKNFYNHYDGKVKLNYTDLLGNSFFDDCSGRLNGYKEDYFENGAVSLKGNFVQGEPKDSLLLFYPNGTVRRHIAYLKKEVYTREYDSLANLIKVSYKSKKRTNPDAFYYSATVYYPDGGVKMIEKKNSDFTIQTTYYPDKNIQAELKKDKKIEYYPDGNIQTETKWKIKADKNLPLFFYKYEIVKKTFYKDGKTSEEIAYQMLQGGRRQPELSLSKAIYFIHWKRFSPDGTEKILFKDMFQEEIIKSPAFLELLNQSLH